MEMMESLEKQYSEVQKTLHAVRASGDRISGLLDDAQESSLDQIIEAIESISSLNVNAGLLQTMRPYDVVSLGKSVAENATLLRQYRTHMRTTHRKKDIFDTVNKLQGAHKTLEDAKASYEKNYNVTVNTPRDLCGELTVALNDIESALLNQKKELWGKAKEIIEQTGTVELQADTDSGFPDEPAEQMIVARTPVKEVSSQLMKDMGVNHIYENILIDLKNQGNVMIETDFEHIREEHIDEFIIAYICRFMESFPLGAVKVHVFDQNPGFLYKRLTNVFQGEKLGELAKGVVQIHTSLTDLLTIRDVDCEDIFKKTSDAKPDLYAIYEEDRSDPFNLIVIRNGMLDASGYSTTDNLEVINRLTKPVEFAHKCGVRFLIIDNSSSFGGNVTDNFRHLSEIIKKNCELLLEYRDDQFYRSGKYVEALGINGGEDTFIQTRFAEIAGRISNRERAYITLEDVAAQDVDDEVGNIMYIPVGKAGENVVELPFSCRDEDGTVAGQCIGYMAIGQSGSGKSSFFHSVVLNGCLKYSPKDLQYWLLDFKYGGASSKYSNSGIPHINIIAENNKVDDALCLFQMVLEEMQKRSEAFNAQSTNDIVEYNRIAAEKGLRHYPRIIIAIDEIQEIFRDDNASELQKLLSAISGRMRFAGMHFVMVAQNLSDGKSYMLKEAFLPNATGRICFRVKQDMPRESGFEDEFVQRKREISELKTGEAYVAYGKDTIKKVKMAYITSQDMSDRVFDEICKKYPEYTENKPLVIGAKKRLSIVSERQRHKGKYYDVVADVGTTKEKCCVVLGEDVYRMEPLYTDFAQHGNSSLLFLGSDRMMASSLCASVVLSLLTQAAEIHMFNADRNLAEQHAFKYICQRAGEAYENVHNYRLNQFNDVLANLYAEYQKRQKQVQMSDDDYLQFSPQFLVINDLYGIDAFNKNEFMEIHSSPADNKEDVLGKSFTYSVGPDESGTVNRRGAIDTITPQNVLGEFVKNGYRYNIHTIIAISGDPSGWRSRVVSDAGKAVFFNSTKYDGEVDNSYYLKEMLKNIANESGTETQAVWYTKTGYSKMRPIVYDLTDDNEIKALDGLLERRV